MADLSSKRILILVGDQYEDLELLYPKLRFREAGAEVVVAGPETGVTYRGKHGYPTKADAPLSTIDEDDFDGIILPGGFMPDRLRRNLHVLDLIRAFAQRGKLVAAICHGGWMAISAKVYDGVRATGSLGIKDDLENAGAIWEDSPVVVDRNFISSRNPDDLPHFCKAILEFYAQIPAK